MNHPSEIDVLEFALGRGGLEQRDELREHLETCDECGLTLTVSRRLAAWPVPTMPARGWRRPARWPLVAAALVGIVLLPPREAPVAPPAVPPTSAAVGTVAPQALDPPARDERDRNRDGRVDVADAMLATREGDARDAREIVVERFGR